MTQVHYYYIINWEAVLLLFVVVFSYVVFLISTSKSPRPKKPTAGVDKCENCGRMNHITDSVCRTCGNKLLEI